MLAINGRILAIVVGTNTKGVDSGIIRASKTKHYGRGTRYRIKRENGIEDNKKQTTRKYEKQDEKQDQVVVNTTEENENKIEE